MRLSDLSDIHSGYTARGRLDPVPEGGVPALQLRDVGTTGEMPGSDFQRYNLNKLSGRYLEVSPPSRLRFTWIWGEGAYAGVETEVTIELKEHREGTELSLLQTGFSDQAMADDHNGGWTGCIDCLETLLQTGDWT